ncbi:MAG: J domain-containing protein [Bacteroidota bacterium]|nr:J domain-containing protein [Bacteroidota bacterium]
MMKTQFFSTCKNLIEVRKLYKELALIHHPDKGGETATMQEINAEYQFIIKNRMFDFEDLSEKQQEEFIIYPEIINQVIGLEGIIIEILGDWIWISGNTYPHRARLKATGFLFAPKKVMWYYRPSEYKCPNHRPLDIEQIRMKYGSQIVGNPEKENKLETA